MRIAYLEIINHPIIGSITIDFTNQDGAPAKHIVIAGDNGCGKTAILEIINALISELTSKGFEYAQRSGSRFIAYVDAPKPESSVEFTYFNNYDLGRFDKFIASKPQFSGIAIDSYGYNILLPQKQFINMPLAQYFEMATRTFYSRAEISFDVPEIRHSSAQVDDLTESPGVRRAAPFPAVSDTNLGKNIAQLFVDIEIADNADLKRWCKEHPNEAPPTEVQGKRMQRFADAFSIIMPHKKLAQIIQKDGVYDIIFDDVTSSTPISQLSTGEKQIVFRGAFLLRVYDYLPGAIVLVDEPELSLHPLWQNQILRYYDALIPETNKQKSQIILATHSPFVVHGSPAAKHIILKRDTISGSISLMPQPAYPGISTGDVAVSAFEMSGISFGRQGAKLAIVTEGKTDAMILQIAWNKLRPTTPRPFAIVPAGGAKTISSLVGVDANKPGWLFDTLRNHGIDRFLCLFDFDDPGYPQWNGLITADKAEIEELDTSKCMFRKRKGDLVWSALLPVPSYRSEYASRVLGSRSVLAIEAMFADDIVSTRLDHVLQPGGGRAYRASESQKNSFAAAVKDFSPTSFKAFEPIFRLADRALNYARIA